jgi:hypothetical protein
VTGYLADLDLCRAAQRVNHPVSVHGHVSFRSVPGAGSTQRRPLTDKRSLGIPRTPGGQHNKSEKWPKGQ